MFSISSSKATLLNVADLCIIVHPECLICLHVHVSLGIRHVLDPTQDRHEWL